MALAQEAIDRGPNLTLIHGGKNIRLAIEAVERRSSLKLDHRNIRNIAERSSIGDFVALERERAQAFTPTAPRTPKLGEIIKTEKSTPAEDDALFRNRYYEAIIIRDRKKGIQSVLDPDGEHQTLGLPTQSAVYEMGHGLIAREPRETQDSQMAEDDRKPVESRKAPVDIYVAPATQQVPDRNKLGLGRNRNQTRYSPTG